MPSRAVIIDSGAFTVWMQGAVIDLREYLDFCVRTPGATAYVALDVIPGVPRDKRSLTKAAVEEACRQSWDNFVAMEKEMPPDTVLPVFHQNDGIKWLGKYLDRGVKWIGISPANDESTAGRMKWLKTIRHLLFDGAGRPTVKTHGFAVTSFDLMKSMEWYSVDSASWKMTASWGGIDLPQKKNGEFVYDVKPHQIVTTPQSPNRRRQQNVVNMTPLVLERVMEFLDTCNVPLGTSVYKDVEPGYKLDTKVGEIWMDKKARKVMVPVVKGVTNSFEMRAIVCAKVVARVNKVVPVRHIFMAGLPMPYKLEFQIRRRLYSYYYCQLPSGVKYIQHNIDLLKAGK